jgi:hypothetical protein
VFCRPFLSFLYYSIKKARCNPLRISCGIHLESISNVPVKWRFPPEFHLTINYAWKSIFVLFISLICFTLISSTENIINLDILGDEKCCSFQTFLTSFRNIFKLLSLNWIVAPWTLFATSKRRNLRKWGKTKEIFLLKNECWNFKIPNSNYIRISASFSSIFP